MRKELLELLSNSQRKLLGAMPSKNKGISRVHLSSLGINEKKPCLESTGEKKLKTKTPFMLLFALVLV